MTLRNRIVSGVFITLMAIILNADVIFSKSLEIALSSVLHSIGEGIIILMFSRELRGQSWM